MSPRQWALSYWSASERTWLAMWSKPRTRILSPSPSLSMSPSLSLTLSLTLTLILSPDPNAKDARSKELNCSSTAQLSLMTVLGDHGESILQQP